MYNGTGSMRLETAQKLHDVKNACHEIQSFTSGKTIEDMWHDRGLQLILHKLVEIVGEALNQASKLDETIEPHIPNLRRFVNVRNYFVHDYGSVDYSIVWQIATERIPQLVPAIDALLESAPPLPGDSESPTGEK